MMAHLVTRLALVRRGATVAAALAAVLAGCAAVPPAAQDPLSGPVSIARQGSFFVGGRDVKSDTLSTLPAYAPAGTVTVGQMYVRYQVPAAGAAESNRTPIVMIHGCCLTGKTWETTPDGRMGWDEYFLRRGHAVYVVDQVSRGRSAANATEVTAVRAGKRAPGDTPPVFMAGQEAAWAIFRFGDTHTQVYPGMRFPLEAIDEFWKQMVPDWIGTLPTPNPTVPLLSQLAQKVGKVVLMSHSQSGIYPFQTAAVSNRGIASIVSIEPGTCPDPKGNLRPYLGMPIMVLWGDYVDRSPRWAPRLKLCREFAEAANKAGGKVENIVLPDLGIKGNSHMLMQDRNSIELAAWMWDWIDRRVERGQ